MANLTLIDIAKMNGGEQVVGLIEENLTYAPEARLIPMTTINGTSYRTLVRTGLPTTGFRRANEGFASSKSSFRNDLFECYPFGGSMQVDKIVADAHEKGPEYVKALEASGFAKSALIELGKQIWYGVTEDSKGFPGLKAFTTAANSMTKDATGTSAGTASSAYLVKFGNDGVQLIGGRGNAFGLGEWLEQMVADSGGTNKYRAYCNSLEGWIGLQTANVYCVARIYNLTAETGKGLTDALIASALDLFPVGMVPDAIFCSRRSRSQLRVARTATTAYAMGGAKRQPNAEDMIVGQPTESHGIPLYVTDSILDTDTIGT
jgi:hypothetical protein